MELVWCNNMAKRKILITCLLVLLMVFLYYFPIQRALAIMKFSDYSMEQGVSSSDIQQKKVFKDYIQDGYYISVTYISDPYHRYDYHYYLLEWRKDHIRLNSMYLDIYDSANNRLDSFDNVVYKPLSQYD